MDWINRELSTGFQKLLCLSLEGQPAAEVIPGTLATWREVLTSNRVFDEVRDAPRFRSAFSCLCARIRRWPVPADFLDAMPRATFTGVKERRFSNHSVSPVVQGAIDEICKTLCISSNRDA